MVKKSALVTVKPEDAGFSQERLARIRPAMQKYIDQKMVPSIVTLVARDGKIVYHDAQGYQDREKKIPATTDTIFRLYSNSKALAGLATMIFFEDGKLNLDDPISKYIPAFKDPRIVAKPEETPTDGRGMPMLFPTLPAKREVTLRDCLRNTTGFATPARSPYWFTQVYKDILPNSGWDMESLDVPPVKSYLQRAELLAKLPLNFNPGTDFLYHTGYPVLGAVLEVITGGLLEDFYQERIFKPLGMKDTSFFLDKKKADRFTCCYIPAFEKGRWDSAFYARFPVSAQPALVGDTPDEDEDHPVEKRFGLQMLDHGERMFEMYGGANSGLLEHYRDALRESSIEISKLRTDNADLREQLERALSAREEREERRLWNALKVKGGERALDTALALMPPLVNKFLGEKVMDSKDTPETLALKPYFKVVAEGGLLSEEQREVIFGKFGDKPPFDQIAAGILSLDQGRILFQVASCEIPADELDRLLPGGDLAVTPDQLSALTSSGLSMAQLMPLQILFDDRLKKRAQKQ